MSLSQFAQSLCVLLARRFLTGVACWFVFSWFLAMILDNSVLTLPPPIMAGSHSGSSNSDALMSDLEAGQIKILRLQFDMVAVWKGLSRQYLLQVTP